MAANFIYNFLGEFQKESVLFFNTDFKPSFKKVMGMKNVQKKFGGDVPPIK